MQTKRIIILSDGTGNSAAKIWRTNVWRLFDALDKQCGYQRAFYDDGVGTSSFKPIAFIGGVFGYGLKKNVIECYKFLCRNYEPGCEISLFGFSRGAFTIRVLIELIQSQGIVRRSGSESHLSRQATAAFREYRRELHTAVRIEMPFRLLRDLFLRNSRSLDTWPGPVPPIKFVGLWDTVAAYGLPVQEWTSLVSKLLYPLDLKSTEMPKIVERTCHALSLDDERQTFHPLVISEHPSDQSRATENGERFVSSERISQVWFAGAHANVGGGYPDDSMAYTPLQWMIDQIKDQLDFKIGPRAEPDVLRMISTSGDTNGRLYNSRSGLAAYYRYAPRDVAKLSLRISPNLPKIHASVFERIKTQTQPYAPLGLPPEYEVVDQNGKILSFDDIEGESNAENRFAHQRLVWNSVLQRSVAYIGIVTFTALLLALPFLSPGSRAERFLLSPISDIIKIIGGPTHYFTGRWTDTYAHNPSTFLLGMAGLLLFVSSHIREKATISDAMFKVWSDSFAGKLLPPGRNFVLLLRSNPILQWLRQFIVSYVTPTAVICLTLMFALFTASHVVFNFMDAAGLYCSPSPDSRILSLSETIELPFPLDAICWSSGLMVGEKDRYSIKIELPDDFDSQPRTFWTHTRSRLTFPLKRSWTRPAGTLTGRVGHIGTDEVFLDDARFEPERIQMPSTGELFFYLDEPVLFIPALTTFLYPPNLRGHVAKLRIVRR